MQIEHSEFQDQLVRGLTHRMNNILTIFHGHVGLLIEDTKLEKSTVDALLKIKDGAVAAAELMERTHSLVRPTTIVWREIDLSDFVRQLRPAFDLMRSPKTLLEIEAPDGLPHVWGDLSRLKTAIIELVRNACEATARGGKVRLSIRADEPVRTRSAALQPIRWVSLTVTDDGPGVPADVDDKIFAPFFTSKKKQNAAGLGLTVALGFVQQLGGAIRYNSESGKTAFEMLLPSRSELR